MFIITLTVTVAAAPAISVTIRISMRRRRRKQPKSHEGETGRGTSLTLQRFGFQRKMLATSAVVSKRDVASRFVYRSCGSWYLGHGET
jgi:hypothetical protein